MGKRYFSLHGNLCIQAASGD